VTIDNLLRLECVNSYFARIEFGGGLHLENTEVRLTSYSGRDTIVITALGLRFVEACSDEQDVDAESISTRYAYSHKINVDLRLQ
jgi:hypothetical protein